MWVLNETNSDVITVAEVREGDIIALEPGHGAKVTEPPTGSRHAGQRVIKRHGERLDLLATRTVLRLR